MYCSKCGSEMEKSSRFCSSCGASQGNQDVREVSQTSESFNNFVDEARFQPNERKKTGHIYVIIGWISMVISLLFIPILFGAIAVIMGYLYRSYNQKHGTVLMIAGVAGTVLGVLIGMLVGMASMLYY